MDYEISEEQYREIEREIASDESPVGIDAKKTHVLILHKLVQIERRLARLEASDSGEAASAADDGGGDR